MNVCRLLPVVGGLVLLTACGVTTAAIQPDNNSWLPAATTIGGLPATSRLVADGKPVELTVTICNNSPINYPSIAPAVLADHCGCAPAGARTPHGTLERFDPTTGTWHNLDFAQGTGMGYLMTNQPATPMPKARRSPTGTESPSPPT